MRRHTLVLGCAVGLFCLVLGLAGCAGGGGGGDDDTNTAVKQGEGTAGVGVPVDVSGRTEAVLDRVFDILFGEGSQTAPNRMTTVARQEQVNLTIGCESGTVFFSGTADAANNAFTINGAITFMQCAGINGSLRLDSAGFVEQSGITFDMDLQGTLNADDCALTFAPLLVNGAATQSGRILSPTFLSGTVNTACASDRFICTPVNVEINNREAFEDSCRTA